VHVSSAWVRGCVHVFVWATHLPEQLSGSKTGYPTSAEPKLVSSALTWHTSSTLPRRLAGAAVAAGVQGEVDVQVGQQLAQRYQVEPDTEPALVATRAMSGADAATATGAFSVELLSITPSCLVVHDMEAEAAADGSTSASTHPSVQLVSRQAQQARVILVANATGAVLLDRTYDIPSGGVTTLRMDIPSDSLAKLAGRHGPNRRGAGGPQPVIPLRMIITTPTKHADPPNPPQPAHVHATATLLAAPAPLASELCNLHEAMQQQGRAQGLSDEEMWAHHWQQLINDLSLCVAASAGLSSAAAAGAGATAMAQHQLQAMKEVTTTLANFFSTHGMTGWEAQMRGVLQALGRQQVDSKQASPEEQAGAGVAAHRDVSCGPASAFPLSAKHSTRQRTPATRGNCEGPLKPAARTSGGKAQDCKPMAQAPAAIHGYRLSFSDRAQEVHYRDWAMRRARVPILVW
jgi:hypothetical protein